MRIRNIVLNTEGLPEAVTVDMTAREAALIARIVGPTSWSDRDKIQSGGGMDGSDIYDSIAGDLFNRFYEDGMNEVPR